MADGPATTKIQLTVDLADDKCSTDIKVVLKSNQNIKNVAVNLEKQTVIVETVLPSHEVVKLIENSGKKALVTGVGAAGNQVLNLGSAVAIMNEGNEISGIKGVTRIVQSTENVCVIDGTLTGLSPNCEHHLGIHEYGDISDGCNSCGDLLNFPPLLPNSSSAYGDLGSIHSDGTGRSSFRIESQRVKVWDVIGRSLVVKSRSQTCHDWIKLGCGIIARSAGLFENFKRICACDGTTIWDEKTSVAGTESKPSANL